MSFHYSYAAVFTARWQTLLIMRLGHEAKHSDVNSSGGMGRDMM